MVKSAADVFLRYGYARTTMAELAAAAHMSRPTLYEFFPSKDDLFAAVVRHLNDDALHKYREALPKLKTLRAKLHHFCVDWATHGLRLAERHPDAKDLFNLEFPVVREMYEQFIRFLFEVISTETHMDRVPLEKVVRNLVFSLRGLKEAAQNLRQMEELVQLQVDIFLTLLSPSEFPRRS